MAGRCGCTGSGGCSCTITSSDSITVSGTGSPSSPFVLETVGGAGGGVALRTVAVGPAAPDEGFDDVAGLYGFTATMPTAVTVDTDGIFTIDTSTTDFGALEFAVFGLPAPVPPSEDHILVGAFARFVDVSSATGAYISLRLVNAAGNRPVLMTTNDLATWHQLSAPITLVTAPVDDAADRAWASLSLIESLDATALSTLRLVAAISPQAMVYPDTTRVQFLYVWRLAGITVPAQVVSTEVAGAAGQGHNVNDTGQQIEGYAADGTRQVTKTITVPTDFDPVAEGLTAGPILPGAQPYADQGQVVAGDTVAIMGVTTRVGYGLTVSSGDDAQDANLPSEWVVGPDGQWHHQTMSAGGFPEGWGPSTNYLTNGMRLFSVTDRRWWTFRVPLPLPGLTGLPNMNFNAAGAWERDEWFRMNRTVTADDAVLVYDEVIGADTDTAGAAIDIDLTDLTEWGRTVTIDNIGAVFSVTAGAFTVLPGQSVDLYVAPEGIRGH